MKHSKKAEKFISMLNELLKKDNLIADAFLGGSLAKNTFLDNIDFDIFIRFDRKKYKDENISKLLDKLVKNNFKKYQLIHGSRDYFQVQLDGELLELIPVIKIDSSKDALNTTDVSPLHVIYVNKKLKNSEDVRKLKLFLKANYLYGAESYLGGFSGYLAELLIIRYKSFEALLKAASKWEEQVVFDLENAHSSIEKMKKILGESKTNCPMIFIDPTQYDRNAANALTQKIYNKFIDLSRKYLLSKNQKSFFKQEKFDFDKIKTKAKKSQTQLLFFNYTPKEGLEDIVGTKVKKGYETLKRLILENDFTIFDSGFHFEKEWASNKGKRKKSGKIYFLINEAFLPKEKKHFGPSIFIKDSKKFVQKYDHVEVEGGKYFTIKSRKITDLKQLKKHLLSKNYSKFFEKIT